MVLPGVPEPPDERLHSAPLRLVVCQVRHERHSKLEDPRHIKKILQQLGEKDWRVEEGQTQEVMVQAGPGGVTSRNLTEPAWKLHSTHDSWVIAIHSNFFSLETADYTRWSDFRDQLAKLTEAVATQLEPAFEHRVGVRFVNEIPAPADEVRNAGDWESWIDERFLGPALHEHLRAAIDSARQVVQLVGDQTARATIQHGPSKDENRGAFYYLDIDCFQELGRGFDAAAIIEAAEALHRFEKQIFVQTITKKLYEHLKGAS